LAHGRWIDPVGDIGTWWSAIYRLAGGERLYRDVHLQFGPLSPYLLAFGARMFGATTAYVASTCWIAAIAAAVLLLRSARPFLSALERTAVAGLVLGISVFAPGQARLVFPYAPGAVHALALSLGAILLVRERKPPSKALPGRAWLAGSLAGLAFAAKQEIGVACLAALVLSAFAGRPIRSGWAARVATAFLAIVALTALSVVACAPVESLREESRLWPLAPAPPESWLRLYRSVAGFEVADWGVVLSDAIWFLLWSLALFALIALLVVREKRLAPWLLTAGFLLALLLWGIVNGFSWERGLHPISLSMTVAFLLAVAALVLQSLPERRLLVALGAFAGLVATRTAVSTHVSGPYAGVSHFATALTWVVFLCVLAPRVFSPSERGRWMMRRFVSGAVLIVGWYAAFGGIRSLSEEWKEGVATREGAIFVDTRLAALFHSISRELVPGERIWVLPEVNGVDALFLAKNASPYPSQMPGWLDERQERKVTVAMELRPPDAVVVFDRETREYGVPKFGIGFGRVLAQWIAANYVPEHRMTGGTIYRKRPAGEAATDRRTR